MVRLLSLILSASFVAATTAAPYFHQQLFTKTHLATKKCLPIWVTDITENQPFQLSNVNANPISLKHPGREGLGKESLVYEGIDGEKTFLPLQLCVVSAADQDCAVNEKSACIHEDVEYRLRIFAPVSGYLAVRSHSVYIVSSYEEATDFGLVQGDGEYVTVHDRSYKDGKDVVQYNVQPGKPLRVVPNKSDDLAIFFLSPI
ncbi:hypothetical protein CPC16_010915 [Podila verticillata]|nr:hypothetical protein BGZ59_010294 [Podila verticillata]KAF9379138.1 hypothetical protein CPC16_010915 [Podila verticillata]